MVNSAVSWGLPPGLSLEPDPLCILSSVLWQPQVSVMLGWYQPALVQCEDVGIDPSGLTIGEHHGQTGLSRVSVSPWAHSPGW